MPSRIPVKKLNRLSQKGRKIRVFIRKGIRKSTPLSSKIHRYLKCRNGYFKRFKSNLRFEQTRSKESIWKRGKMYYSRRATAMKYRNRVLRKYLPLCTCNYPFSVYKSFNHKVICSKFKLSTDIEKNPGPLVDLDATKTICAPYCQGNVAVFGQNAGQQCVAMSLCALMYNKIKMIDSTDDLIQIMNVGNELYSSLSLLARQSLLMLTELPTMISVFEECFQLEYSESYTGNMHGDATIEGYQYCMPLGRAFETLLSLGYNSIILTVGCIGVGIYSINNDGFKVFDSHARDVYGYSDPEGTCVLLEMRSMNELVEYFQSLYRNNEVYELKGIHIDKIELDVSSSNVEGRRTSNINSYECSCKQCCAIAVFAMCYSVINPCGYWYSKSLGDIVNNGNGVYNGMGIDRHIMPADLPKTVSVYGAEMNVVLHTESHGVLSCNLIESKSTLEMLILNNCRQITGFLLWLGTYCISCVFQQSNRIKQLFSLLAYDDSCSPAVKHIKGIKGIHLVVEAICKLMESKLNCQSVQYEIQFISCLCESEGNKTKDIYIYYICCVCNRLLYKKSVLFFCRSKYPCENYFTVHASFDGKQYICKSCDSKVKDGKLPCQAVVNKMYVDDISMELASLEKLEQILIAQRIIFQKIVFMPKGQQRKIKGAICNVPVECDETCSVLPRPSERSGIVMLKLKRKLEFKGHVYFQAVRPELILEALNWLKTHNFLYKKIKVDLNNIDGCFTCLEHQRNNDNEDENMDDEDIASNDVNSDTSSAVENNVEGDTVTSDTDEENDDPLNKC